MSRKKWKAPKIKHAKFTKRKYLVWYPKGLKLGINIDIGALTLINARHGVIIQNNVKIGGGCKIYSDNTINGTQGTVIIKKGAMIGANSVILPNVIIEENQLVKAGSVISK